MHTYVIARVEICGDTILAIDSMIHIRRRVSLIVGGLYCGLNGPFRVVEEVRR